MTVNKPLTNICTGMGLILDALFKSTKTSQFSQLSAIVAHIVSIGGFKKFFMGVN